MSSVNSDVILVSAFGRAHWLASEFKKQGLKVYVIDVSHLLGLWPVEDLEGPFGFLQSEKYVDTFLERMNNDDAMQVQDNGFTFWTKNQPIEMKGPLTKFVFEKQGWSESYYNELMKGERAPTTQAIDFQQRWIWAAASHVASTRFLPSIEHLQKNTVMPVGANFSVRQATRAGFEKSKTWLQNQGVDFTDQANILDVAFQGKNISAIELKGPQSGLVSAKYFVWCLSSEETQFLKKELCQKLFNRPALTSEWTWLRYRFELSDCTEVQRIPDHVCWIRDIHSPWTHENMMMSLRTSLTSHFDFWILLPSSQRFNKDYIEEYSHRITKEILQRMPLSNPQIKNYPQEYYYTYVELGPPRFCLLPGPTEIKLNSHLKNCFFDSLETRFLQSRDAEYNHQFVLKNKLIEAWKIEMNKINKRQKVQKEAPL